jgi:AraC-like DNA-binding protein
MEYQMNQLLLNKFQDFIATHYSDCNLSIKSICSDLSCSRSTLQRVLASSNNCSIMKHVEYFRILKAIELTYYKKQKKVYRMVGYKIHSSFYRAFFRVTKLHTSYFSPSRFKENKKVAREVRNIAKENPEEAIKIIFNDVVERYKLKNGKMSKKETKMSKKETKKITK